MVPYGPMIDHIKKEIDRSLELFLERIRREYKLHLVDPILFESIREFTLREGKRIRPLLLILSFKGYSIPGRELTPDIYSANNSPLVHLLYLKFLLLRRLFASQHPLGTHAAAIGRAAPLGAPAKYGAARY